MGQFFLTSVDDKANEGYLNEYVNTDTHAMPSVQQHARSWMR